MQVEESKDPEKLVPAGILAWSEGVVPVATNRQCARLFHFQDRVSRKGDGFIKKDDVRLVLPHSTQQIAVDAMDKWPNWRTDRGGPQKSRALLISGNVENDQILAEPAKTRYSVAGTRSWSCIAHVENPAFPWSAQ
jgi:hypothetical protein